MPATTPAIRSALAEGSAVRRTVQAMAPVAGRDGKSLLVMLGKSLPPFPAAVTPSQLLQRLDALGSDLDVRGLLADGALGRGVPVILVAQDGGEAAFLHPPA